MRLSSLSKGMFTYEESHPASRQRGIGRLTFLFAKSTLRVAS